MDDRRVWEFEESLWKGDAEVFRNRIDPDCQMVVPAEPFLLTGAEAVEAMAGTPRWAEVSFRNGRISRPADGLIVIAYTAEARSEGGTSYLAHCTSTFRRIGHADWRVIQHQQTPPQRAGQRSAKDGETGSGTGA
jgi:hypothetical protein